MKVKDRLTSILSQDNFEAVNWNTLDNNYVQTFWDQNVKQFWIDTEYVPSRDLDSYKKLDPKVRDVYNKILGGLTLLDTEQSHVGMTSIIPHVNSMQCKSVLSFMNMMESIHAKSYSTIFTTVASTEVIDEIFEWVKDDKNLQFKIKVIDSYYDKLFCRNAPLYDLYMALVASILLESFLFYSGFFLPLYLSGQGQMVASGDIIKKIVADESIHGIFVGLLAQEVYENLSHDQQLEADEEVEELFKILNDNEIEYTKSLYTDIGLVSDVLEYLKYNANKAFTNLGRPNPYSHVDINPIVLNSLNLESTQHDFFSNKSTNYERSIESVSIRNEDFDDLDLSVGV